MTGYRNVRRWTMEYAETSPVADAGFEGTVKWNSSIPRDDYLDLYRGVGERWNWFNRVLMPPEELAAILQQPGREVGVLQNPDAANAGFAELFFHSIDEVEICYFGLLPQFTGLRLGSGFFSNVLRHIRNNCEPTARIWLTTCEWDSPAALPFYQKMGFRVVATDVCQQEVPAGFTK